MTTFLPNAGLPNAGFRSANQDGPDVTVIRLASVRRAAPTIAPDDLHAYVDGSLDPGCRSTVEALLARDPDAQSAVRAYRDLNIDLHRLFDRDLPPIVPPLEALVRELDRRVAASRLILSSSPHGAMARILAFAMRPGRQIMRRIRWFARNPLRGADASLILDRAATAIDRSPLASVIVVAAFILMTGIGWPMVAAEPASCSERVDAAAKQAATARPSPELAERLANVGFMCRVGEADRADQLLARLDEETRRFQH